jgi:uncharacterized protein YegP (UPF0339 family)
MNIAFELKANDDRGYFFRLVDGSGETLLLSAEYADKAEAAKGIADVRVGSLMGNQIAAGKTKTGETFFVIKDGTGEIIAKSLLFSSPMLFDNALHNVKDNACVAELSDLT